jgi:DNA gyrase/topoisomerase IV subunit A
MTASQSIDRGPSTLLELKAPELSAELADVEGRLELVRALVDALGRLGELNRVIQSSATAQGAREALRRPPFGYSDAQASAVLALPMSCQNPAEVEHIRQDMEHLLARRASLREQLSEGMALHWFG